MKYHQTSSVFQFPWDQVATAFWNRYPNPYASHVLTEDTVKRSVEQGQLVTKRLISKAGTKVPKWGERFIPRNKQVFIVEESIVDPETQTLTTYTRNIGMTKVMLIEEKCVYRPCPDNRQHTVCQREAFVSSNIFGFGRALQSFGLDRFKKSAAKTVQGYEYILNRMFLPEKLPEVPAQKLNMKAEKLKSTAQKAKELAQSKAASVIVTN